MSDPKPPRKVSAPLNYDILVPKVASLLALNKSAVEIAQELGIAFKSVKKIEATPECRAVVKEIGEAAITAARASVRKSVSDLKDLAVEVLKEHLKKERSLEAVKTAFKVIGVMEVETQTAQGATSLTVILPSNDKPPETTIVLPESDIEDV